MNTKKLNLVVKKQRLRLGIQKVRINSRNNFITQDPGVNKQRMDQVTETDSGLCHSTSQTTGYGKHASPDQKIIYTCTNITQMKSQQFDGLISHLGLST